MLCKRTLLRVLCFLFITVPSAASATDTPSLPAVWTVQEAVGFALDNSPDVRIALQRIKGAQAAVVAAQSAYYPSIGLSAGYGRTNNPMYSFGNILNQGQFTQDIDFNNPGTSDNLNMTGSVQYRFYNGGSDEAGVRAARAGEQAVRFEQEAIYSRLGFEVVRSFYSIVQAEENVQARESALKAIEVSLQTAQARFDAGDLLKADLLNLEVQQSRAAENLILARHGLELVRRGFLNLLGLKQGSAKIDTAQQARQAVPENPTYEQRPELTRLNALFEAAEAKVRQARGGYYPSADLFGSYQVDKGFEFDEGSGNSWIAGVKVNYNLFNGHRTSAEINRATAELAEIREQRQKLELAFNYEIEQASLAFKQAEERLQVTKKMVEQAIESGRLSRERFKEGVTLASDLIEVENRLTDARVHNLMAKASRRIAIADLRRAAGLGQFE
ncbi:MAG: TolC family protein [Thermodesulfobacteriota bacterium]|nr:TolC family protein [Thermodesulfobacteriota bacterium]